MLTLPETRAKLTGLQNDVVVWGDKMNQTLENILLNWISIKNVMRLEVDLGYIVPQISIRQLFHYGHTHNEVLL